MADTRRKPSFLIIGAQKAGTSSLFWYLSQHPDIRLPQRKELHFFDLRYGKGIDWYEGLFPTNLDSSQQITGEASPYYLFHPRVPERVWRHYPNIRLIALLRNPVDRAYSHFHMERKRSAEPEESFMRAVELEEHRIGEERRRIGDGMIESGDRFRAFSYLSRGLYGQQIARWRQYFPADQFLFLKSEDFFDDPIGQLWRVYDFLNVTQVAPKDIGPVNSGTYQELAAAERRILQDYFKEDSVLCRQLIGDEFVWF